MYKQNPIKTKTFIKERILDYIGFILYNPKMVIQQETITLKNTDRILRSLEVDNYITPSQLCRDLNMNNISVNIGLEFLDRVGLIEIVSNGKTKLVRLKNGNKTS